MVGAECGARTRAGNACKCRALDNGRCKLHGGLSTGPKTPEGRRRAIEAMREGNRRWRKSGGKARRDPALTARQERFRHLYPLTRNAALAAEQAGYAPRSAQQIGSALLRHPLIAPALRAYFGPDFDPGAARGLGNLLQRRARRMSGYPDDLGKGGGYDAPATTPND